MMQKYGSEKDYNKQLLRGALNILHCRIPNILFTFIKKCKVYSALSSKAMIEYYNDARIAFDNQLLDLFMLEDISGIASEEHLGPLISSLGERLRFFDCKRRSPLLWYRPVT